ncbi:hypothetical protein E2C01_053873 [Portunus trituberculatus]|uniref:Uncharacterized protein n=1 Tax=Portunus trituberculatus TaxID=210409 RepID=A0A5B7GR81_PORTR|nr:hypothetical protein [Portunus trituberculatus]
MQPSPPPPPPPPPPAPFSSLPPLPCPWCPQYIQWANHLPTTYTNKPDEWRVVAGRGGDAARYN